MIFSSPRRFAARPNRSARAYSLSRSIPDAVAKAREEAPALIIADLNASCCDVLELARALKSDDALTGVPLLGFFSHIQTELQQAAIAAGYDRVMPRSAFTKNLAEILAGTGEG